MKIHQSSLSRVANKFLTNIMLFACSLALPASLNVFAQQSDDLSQQQTIKIEETIRGNANQEQPKVLTIVPWQQPTEKQALPSPISERLSRQFTPLEREEFRRQIRFFEHQTKPIE